MRPLWLRLLRGGRQSAWLEIAVPLVAGGVITVVLLLMLGLQQGLDHRADRTAWRTPEPAQAAPSVIQGGYTDFVDGDPLAVTELAALSESPPNLPGTTGFPNPGEVWVSPALATLIERRPPAELADRFPSPPTQVLPEALLEHPDELVAVVGHRATDPVMQQARPKHQWNEASSISPTEIDGWSTTPDLYQTTYRDIALLATVLVALPLVGLGDLASRMMAGRRQRRLATLRLLGARTSTVAGMTFAEVATLTGLGAALGALVHRLLAPTVFANVPIKGGGWFSGDIMPSPLLTLGLAAAVTAVFAVGALFGIVHTARDPLGAYRRSHREPVRLWGAILILAAIAVFWMRSTNVFVSIAFTAVVLLGGGLLATGPVLVGLAGRFQARSARRPSGFLAGRRLADSPQGAWRTASGMAMAAYVAGFAAICLPVGLNVVGQQAERSDEVAYVLPSGSIDSAVTEATAVLREARVEAQVHAEEPPFWFTDTTWATLVVETAEPNHDRARTALAARGIGGPEMLLADDLPNRWLVLDGVVIGALILPIAGLVALVSMTVGAIARVYDQREPLTLLRLAGAPRAVMVAAQRDEMFLPALLLGGVGATAGVLSGSAVGATSLVNPYTAAMATGLVVLASASMVVADRLAVKTMDRATADLSERE